MEWGGIPDEITESLPLEINISKIKGELFEIVFLLSPFSIKELLYGLYANQNTVRQRLWTFSHMNGTLFLAQSLLCKRSWMTSSQMWRQLTSVTN